MKIALDISQIVYQGTGIATYTANLVENLLKVDKQNEYLLFGSAWRQKERLIDFVRNFSQAQSKIISLPPYLLEKIWNQFHFWPVEKFIGPVDVFHSSDWLEPPAKAKKVTTIHDLAVYKFPESFKPRGGHDIAANQKKKLFWVKKEADLVIVDSKATQKDTIEILGIPEEKIRVVYLAAEDRFRPQSASEIKRIRQKYGLAENYFLSVGTLEPRKNLKGVIEAYQLLANDFPKWSLAVVGKFGWGENIIKIQKKGVKILGFVPARDLPGLYAGAQCFLYPSFYEGFGLPILESMACGCPVVTSAKGSLAEVAGKAGVLVDPAKPAKVALGIREAIRKRQALIQEGFKQARLFSWRETARRTLAVYQEAARC